jgi:hypothetical protein
MKARIKGNCRWGVITAFSGCEYVKYEFRNVPAPFESQAVNHPALEVEADENESKPEEIEQGQAKAEPVNKSRPAGKKH